MTAAEFLDGLDAARAAATPGPWQQDGTFVVPLRQRLIPTGKAADAALIVAAVNALPKLTAALRAVEAEIADWSAADFWHRGAIRSVIDAALAVEP